MTFPEQLKAARTASGLTQAGMASKLGVDKTTYCGYETGRRQPDINKLRQLITLLDVSAARDLCKTMGRVFTQQRGWSYGIITPEEDFEDLFGRKADKRRKLYNGMIKCQFYQYFK